MNKIRFIAFISILICLLIVIPAGFAVDNETVIAGSNDNQDSVLASVPDDALSTNDYYFDANIENDSGNGSIDNPYKELKSDRIQSNSTIHLADGEYNFGGSKDIYKVSIIGENPSKTIIKNANFNVYTSFSLHNVTLLVSSIFNNENLTAINCIFKDSTSSTSGGAIYSIGIADLVNCSFIHNSVKGLANIKNPQLYGGAIYSSGVLNLFNCSFVNNFVQGGYKTINSKLYGGAIYSSGVTNLDVCSFVNNFLKDGEKAVSSELDGGAIYVNDGHFENCTFIGNSALNGGSIYVNDGHLENCTFIGNSALNGGSIYVNDGHLENCTFINNTANLGGAIYIYKGFLFINNSLFINNVGELLGGAINSLNSTLKISNDTFKENKAGFDGGSIYSLDSNLSFIDSLFISNSAKTGGALYVDVSRSIFLDSNKFINNSALDYGGAICLFYPDNITINENNYYENNSASDFPNEYISNFFQIFIGDGNYTMLMNEDISFDGEIPSYYSLKDEGYVTPVKNQWSSGSCWSFASLAVLESCIKKATGLEFDLSENNMKNLITSNSYYGWIKLGANSGGYASTGYNYLISWLGPVSESSDPFNEYSTISSLLHSIFHVQNVMFLQRSNYTDNDEIKKAIMKYGGVNTQIYSTGNKYQYYTGDKANHAVCIVGWNDDLVFNGAPGKGGWIVKNSHGTGSGDQGYFYVSYYDTSCVPIGKVDTTYTIILNDTIKFDKNYQYDIPGRTDFFCNSSDTVWYKNKFNATDNEYLAAVSTHFEKNTDWEISIYVNDQLKHTQSGNSKPGYYTINLNNFIQLNKGDIFEVIFKITVDGEASFPISEKISLNKLFYGPNLSYLSYDGITWTDLYDLEWTYTSHTYDSQVACIKAFTILNPVNTTINITVDNPYNPSLIKAVVLNQYGYPVLFGNVTFNIDGNDYVAEIVDGVASLLHDFKNFGMKSISASFEKVGFNPSHSQKSVYIYNESLEIGLNIIVGLLDAEIDIILSKSVNQTVYVDINNTTYNVNVTNGIGRLFFNDLSYGKYDVTAYIVSDYYYCENVTDSYNITHINTFIKAADYVGYYADNFNYSVQLVDKNGLPIKGKSIRIIIGDVALENMTDDNGIALFNLKLACGDYKINITCPEDETYLKSEEIKNVTVKSTIFLLSDSTYTFNSDYVVCLIDSEGNNLNNTEFILSIGNANYTLMTDANGILVYNFKLSPGSYKITVNNLATGEAKSQNIDVVKRITENKALTMYYGAGKSYKVKVFDDNGNIAKGVEVIFTINNKQYTRTTDSQGYASFKISQKPGKYTITAEYKGFKVSNKITVKSTIITKNIAVKKGKTIKFTAKLVNKNGKILKNKKITLKFKGKTYKVKTNKKGKAILKITKKYKKGKYTIKTSYGKLQIKNKIRIK